MSPRQLIRWQWQGYRHTHASRANLVIHVITVPAFLLGTVAVVYALLTLRGWWAVAGVLAMAAAMALQGIGHRLEPNAPAPFTGFGNAASRIFLEQWVTFPRYLLSGSWRRNSPP